MTILTTTRPTDRVDAPEISTETRRTLERHRRVWARKRVLRDVYYAYFRTMLEHASEHRPIVEIGSGPGFLKEFAPGIISTDVEPLPWIDRVVDGCRLPFDDGSVGNLVMMDVFHHLPKSYDFLEEASRVLKRGGRVVMIEPWTSPLGRFVFGYLCHEGIDRHADPADPFGEGKDAMDGNAALPRIVFDGSSGYSEPQASACATNGHRVALGGLSVLTVQPRPAFTYLLTGGFKPVCLLPRPMLPVMRWVDRIAAPLSGLVALRALIVLEKQ